MNFIPSLTSKILSVNARVDYWPLMLAGFIYVMAIDDLPWLFEPMAWSQQYAQILDRNVFVILDNEDANIDVKALHPWGFERLWAGESSVWSTRILLASFLSIKGILLPKKTCLWGGCPMEDRAALKKFIIKLSVLFFFFTYFRVLWITNKASLS